MKPIALQLYTLREAAQADFAGVLQQVAEIGYVAVEFAGLHGVAPVTVKQWCDDLGLQVCSAHMALPTADNAAQLIDECGALGCTKLVSGYGPDQFKTLELCRATAARFQQAAELLQPAGIKFGMHNHYWEFEAIDGQMPEDVVLAAAPSIFAELDVYWAEVGCGDAPGSVKRLAARCDLLHIKDGPVEPRSPMTAVGQGKVDLPAVIAAADPSVTEWLIVELDACATDMLQAVRDSYSYLVGQGLARGNR
ncbi:MAG: sugar phosphate isomerase/epimerase [Fimbriimonadaceae bacterium]|nr:sugar phosphate isomerase/epimerase [Fimbriimonadaceae bacterium]